jgi:hypothetical protein
MDSTKFSPVWRLKTEQPMVQNPATTTVSTSPSLLQKISQDAQTMNEKERTDRPLTAMEQVGNALLLHPSSSILCTIGIVGFASKSLIEVLELSKKKDSLKALNEVARKQLKQEIFSTLLKRTLIGGGLGILAGIGLSLLTTQYYTPKASVEAHGIVEAFNKKNGVQSKLTILPIPLQPITVLAAADAMSGNLVLNPLLVKDFLYSKWLMKPVLNHELKHLEQFILMGCSPNDGLRRLRSCLHSLDSLFNNSLQ